MPNESKKPSDESVAAVEKWAESESTDAAFLAFAEMPSSSVAWREMRGAIASLLDAQRDAVLDEVLDEITREVFGNCHPGLGVTTQIFVASIANMRNRR